MLCRLRTVGWEHGVPRKKQVRVQIGLDCPVQVSGTEPPHSPRLGLQIARIAVRERNAAVRNRALGKIRRLKALGADGEARRAAVHAAEQAEQEALEDYVLSRHPDHAQWL